MTTQASPADDRVIETPDPKRGAPPRVLLAVLIGCGAAALFGSGPLLEAARALPDGPGTTWLQSVAMRWDGAMASIGATQPYSRLRAGIRFFEGWNAPS